jgi:hypothetical protein
MTTFRSLELFASGPHRVTRGPRALSLVPNFQLGEPGAGTTLVGAMEWEVIVEGRLVASTRSALWALRDAFTDLITNEPETGLLELSDGREFEEMLLVSYTETGPVVPGRGWSVGYKAVFRYRK